ncbi:hypothetical protein ACI77F_23125 [Pseudomonas tritici]|uniref:hypothetical protein n=1 Tax=Pseudomonas tritici TaxID=2745518 RepID=UPI00387B0F2A
MTSSGTNQLLNAEPASFCVIFNQIPKHGFLRANIHQHLDLDRRGSRDEAKDAGKTRSMKIYR